MLQRKVFVAQPHKLAYSYFYALRIKSTKTHRTSHHLWWFLQRTYPMANSTGYLAHWPSRTTYWQWNDDYPYLITYERFVAWMPRLLPGLFLLLKWLCANSECTGFYIINSKPLAVCHNKRIHSHRVLAQISRRGHCMKLPDKLKLRKRWLIESVNDLLTSVFDIEHTRHRSPINAQCNICSGLIAYCFLDHKPSVIVPNQFQICP